MIINNVLQLVAEIIVLFHVSSKYCYDGVQK